MLLHSQRTMESQWLNWTPDTLPNYPTPHNLMCTIEKACTYMHYTESLSEKMLTGGDPVQCVFNGLNQPLSTDNC